MEPSSKDLCIGETYSSCYQKCKNSVYRHVYVTVIDDHTLKRGIIIQYKHRDPSVLLKINERLDRQGQTFARTASGSERVAEKGTGTHNHRHQNYFVGRKRMRKISSKKIFFLFSQLWHKGLFTEVFCIPLQTVSILIN